MVLVAGQTSEAQLDSRLLKRRKQKRAHTRKISIFASSSFKTLQLLHPCLFLKNKPYPHFLLFHQTVVLKLVIRWYTHWSLWMSSLDTSQSNLLLWRVSTVKRKNKRLSAASACSRSFESTQAATHTVPSGTPGYKPSCVPWPLTREISVSYMPKSCIVMSQSHVR